MIDILGEAMKPHLTRDLVRTTAMNRVSSPKTAARYLYTAGVNLPPDALLRAAELNQKRWQQQWSGRDPLLLAQDQRKRRLAQYKRLKRVRSAAMYRAWRKDFRERVEQVARGSDEEWKIGLEAERATMEAIVRAARRRGWQVRHTSTHNARASSRYIVVPGIGECRVSNHEIPETAERVWRASEGRRQRWNGEVIIGQDWQTIGLATWLRRVLLAAAGRR